MDNKVLTAISNFTNTLAFRLLVAIAVAVAAIIISGRN